MMWKTTHRRGMRAGLIAAAGTLMTVFAGCGDDGDDALSPCAEMFRDGNETPDLNRQPRCTDVEGDQKSVAQMRWDCADGGQLFANEYGYGVRGEPWRTDDRLTNQRDDFEPGTPLRAAIDACEGG